MNTPNQSKHTPGPWNVDESCDGRLVVQAGSLTVCLVGAPIQSAEADALLIASAPELLAACELLVALEDNDADDYDTRWKSARKAMRSAILKAKGNV